MAYKFSTLTFWIKFYVIARWLQVEKDLGVSFFPCKHKYNFNSDTFMYIQYILGGGVGVCFSHFRARNLFI